LIAAMRLDLINFVLFNRFDRLAAGKNRINGNENMMLAIYYIDAYAQ